MRSIKKPFKKILGRSTLSFDDLRTVLVEIEGVVNSRPLTYLYDDEELISYPLTPSDLIYVRRIMYLVSLICLASQPCIEFRPSLNPSLLKS